jgi:nitrate/nitrite transport system ATP-binding protein
MNHEHLVLWDVSIEFATPKGTFKALDKVNLRIDKGEFISIIGHSGCGKSTVLNIVAGLLKASGGGVMLDGREVNEPGPERAVVFQHHSLLPWLTAYENVGLAVKQVFKGRKTKREMDAWIRHNLELVHMSHALHKRPAEISGGMKQRVGIARALAMEPKVLLMDEPFGALDALTRAHMQDSLMEIQARLNNTVIMITHDVDEAVLLSDRIVMMTNGPAATVGEILEIDLPRPRDRLALADDAHYNHLRAEVLRFLHERHRKPDIPAPKRATATPAAPAAPGGRERQSLEKTSLNLGFIPLVDCAPLVIAKEKGFFADQGLDVALSRESAWSALRDKLRAGLLDGAHLLSGIPLAAAARPGNTPLLSALSLNLNGNGITVSNALYERLCTNTKDDLQNPQVAAKALKRFIGENKLAGNRPLTFATVFAESSHNYLLRYWMASAGIDPDNDVRLLVIPPQQMVTALRDGDIAGFCVGAPWNGFAVSQGVGHMLFRTHAIWNNHPEKVFAVTAPWAEQNPDTHLAVLRALLAACQWLDSNADNRSESCKILERENYVAIPATILADAMNDSAANHADGIHFHRFSANFPWRSHAVWQLLQMLRWGQISSPVNITAIAEQVYRPDLFRAAASSLEIQCPLSDYKDEGVHSEGWTLSDEHQSLAMGADMFMDGRAFNHSDPAGYLEDLPIRRQSTPLLLATNLPIGVPDRTATGT